MWYLCPIGADVAVTVGQDGLEDALDVGAVAGPALAHHLHELAVAVEGHLVDAVVQRAGVVHAELQGGQGGEGR